MSMFKTRKIIPFLLIFALINLFTPIKVARAAAPAAPYYELCVNPVTGNDCTGDGGGGGGYALNEFYVGQTFNAAIRMSTGGINTVSANVIVHYDPAYLQVNDALPDPGVQISPGALYANYPLTGNTVAGGIIKLTGFDTTGAYNGTGTFGTISFTVLQQREAMYSTASPLNTWIEFTPGSTIDSNIVEQGTSNDVLNAVENSDWYLWPDDGVTFDGDPYVDTVNYENVTNVPVEANSTFHFKDISAITGPETGVNTASLDVLIDSGAGYVNRDAWTSFSCAGIWGTNDCTVTINPPDTGNRNWNYYQHYAVRIMNGQDKASATQAPAGPNTMAQYDYWFETEQDDDAPDVASNAPTGTGTVDTNIAFRVRDLKWPGGITEGTGVNTVPLRMDVNAASTGLNTYSCGDGMTTCTPVITNGLTWAYDVVINPPADFAQNEQVFVTVRNATDFALPSPPRPNTMTPFNWSFWTTDTTPPYIDGYDPIKASGLLVANTPITFHAKDDGVGVDINTLNIRINNDFYSIVGPNTFTYSGDSSDYLITINPVTPFDPDTPVGITINVRDISNNILSPEDLYAVNYDTTPSACPTCPTCAPSQTTCPTTPTTTVAVPSAQQLVQAPQQLEVIQQEIAQINQNFTSQVVPQTKVAKINNMSVGVTRINRVSQYKTQFDIDGETVPNAQVVVYIYSQPTTVKTTADAKGKWKVTVNKAFDSGQHLVLLQVNKQGQQSLPFYGAQFDVVSKWEGPVLPVWVPLLLLGLGMGVVVFQIRRTRKKAYAYEQKKS